MSQDYPDMGDSPCQLVSRISEPSTGRRILCQEKLAANASFSCKLRRFGFRNCLGVNWCFQRGIASGSTQKKYMSNEIKWVKSVWNLVLSHKIRCQTADPFVMMILMQWVRQFHRCRCCPCHSFVILSRGSNIRWFLKNAILAGAFKHR